MLQVLWELEVKQSSTCAWRERVRDGTVGRSLCKALRLPPIFHWSPVPVLCDKTVKGLQRRHSLKAQKPKIAAAAADMKWFEAGRAAGTAALSGWRISARGARLVRKQLPWPTFSTPCEARLWIWFGEIGWADFFSFFPSAPYKKKNGWRQLLLNTGGQILSTCLQIVGRETSVSWSRRGVWFGGGTEVPRGAGGQVGPAWKEPGTRWNLVVCCLKNRNLTWDWKKMFCLKEESFLRSEHSGGVTNPSAPQLTRHARWAAAPPRRRRWWKK